ncbi:MAG: hypothetical protein AABW83_03675 [Nanoarchaeota archaeon]
MGKERWSATDRIYFEKVKPALEKTGINQERFDELRRRGFSFGVYPDNFLDQTDYKRKKLLEIMNITFPENAHPSIIGRKYQEAYNRGRMNK